ncbi:hypothetical protein [Nocardia sp. alder85J]|uniref:hypothetical protein n=1 Tax=Nocardia sp. alder85J TaxID=2862949 RepID=UPI0022598484|nr:hypothetical protein [Nocardia sp. alder85J]MCX4096667.1 hypothetical protein [Nocardia sp. alder85J]
MKSYDAAFSASFHTPWQNADPSTHGATVPPSVYFLSGNGNGADGVRYERYAWATEQGKPWLGDQPLDSGSLFDLLGGSSIFTPDNPHGLDGTKPLDAALCFESASKVYLFQGANCYRVSVAKPTSQELDTDTQARTIASVFGYDFDDGGGKEFPFESVTASLYSVRDRKLWFFHDTDCESVDDLEFEPDHWKNSGGDGTVPSIRDAWPDLPHEFTDKVAWAATVIDGGDGTYLDRAYISNGPAVCAVVPSTQEPANYTVIFTEPGDHPFSTPANVSRITIELWGTGGTGGTGGSGYGAAGNVGGDGGAGAYLKYVLTTAPSGPVTVHIGGPGDYTCYPAQDPILVAGGGGGGGGGGGDGTYDGYGGDGGHGGGGDGGDGSGGNLGGGGGSGGVGSSADGTGSDGGGSEGGAGGSRGDGGSGGYEGDGGGGGGGGGRGYRGEGTGGTGGEGGGGGDTGSGGGGGGAQGPSHYPESAVFEPSADSDPRTPYAPLNESAGFGGRGGDARDGGEPGGNGAARITVEIG